jgi:hypothetical protein
VNAEVILLVAGCLFLGIAVVGGGFSAKEITVPLVSTNGRVASGVLGACLLCGAALLILSGATDRVAASPEPNPPAPQTITLTQSSPTNPSLSPSASAAPPATPTSPASTAGTAHPQEQIPDDDVPPGSVQSAGSVSAQQKLLELVPASVQEFCVPSRFGLDKLRTRASLECRLPDGIHVDFHWFHTSAQMLDVWNQNQAGAGIEPGGYCSTSRWNAASTWQRGDDPIGDIQCFTHDGQAVIEWTYDAMNMSGYASRTDGDTSRLFEWWKSVGSTTQTL